MNLLLKWDGGVLLAFFVGVGRWLDVEWHDGKMPDYKGLYCDLLGRGYAPELARQIYICTAKCKPTTTPK